MEKVDIKVCVRPYFHDVVDEITRKPKFDKLNDRHYVRYKNRDHTLVKNGHEFIIWIEDK
jgi:hypothetical protein